MTKNAGEQDTKPLAKSKSSELVKRIISGVVMAVGSLFLTIYSPVTFYLLVLVGAALMSWEWVRFLQGPGDDQSSLTRFIIHIGSVSAAIILFILVGPVFGLAAVLGGACLSVLFCRPGVAKLSLTGPLYTGLPALALVWLRGDENYGLIAILFIFLVVWMADIGAYAVGRTIGGAKLLPRISPNKTWSGAFGGLGGAALVGVAMAFFLESYSMLPLTIVAVLLAIISQLGDLYESSIKRRFGVKDSSNLIPGHGGILDRVDGLIAAACLAALIALLTNPAQPGHAILIW